MKDHEMLQQAVLTQDVGEQAAPMQGEQAVPMLDVVE